MEGEEEVKKVKKIGISIFFLYCRYPVIRKVAESLGWTIILKESQAMEADVIWNDLQITNVKLSSMKAY